MRTPSRLQSRFEANGGGAAGRYGSPSVRTGLHERSGRAAPRPCVFAAKRVTVRVCASSAFAFGAAAHRTTLARPGCSAHQVSATRSSTLLIESRICQYMPPICLVHSVACVTVPLFLQTTMTAPLGGRVAAAAASSKRA